MRDDLHAQLALDDRWQLVQRVVSSQAFAGSQPLQDFLLYISEKTLRGLADEIKEQTVGSEVLRRTADFDAASDNIVRVRARQLRQKLTQYFESEGRLESVVITIPRGGYVPAFESRSAAHPTEVVSGAVTVPAAHPVPEGRPAALAGWRWQAALGWALAGIFAVACVVLWVGTPRTSARPTLSPNSSRLWHEVFGKGQTTMAVFSDPGFGIWQSLKHKDLNLQEYLNLHEVPEPDSGGPDLTRLLGNNTISLSAAHFLTGAIPIIEALEAALRVRSTRQVDVNDFKSGNAILFGSRRSNPWAELFEPRLHYAAMYPEGSRSFFKERIATGTAATFPTNGSAGTPPTDSYALIALLPNLANTGKVLFIEGLTMEGTDAASEFLLNPQSCDLLVQRVLSELGSLKPFEALLQLTPVSGGAANVRLIRLRAI
jgi:hypothetical protein